MEQIEAEGFTVLDLKDLVPQGKGKDVNMPDGRVCPDHFRGWLLKWTNYIKGYQRRWFVLSDGLLSYYRNQAEMAHTCRGTINLSGAFIDTTEDACSFIISNGGTQVFHLRASSEVERQRWVTALELAKAKAIKILESDEEDENCSEGGESIRPLNAKLEDLQTCNDLVGKHGAALQRSIGELQETEDNKLLLHKLKTVNEKSTLFRITANAMISACAEFLDLAQSQQKRWERSLQHERTQRARLEETVEALAKQHHMLERKCQNKTGFASPEPAGAENSEEEEEEEEEEDDENEFFDAISEHPEGFAIPVSGSQESLGSTQSNSSSEQSCPSEPVTQTVSHPQLVRSSSVPPVLPSVQDIVSLEEGTNGPSMKDLESGSFRIPTSSSSQKLVARQWRTSIPEKPDYSINLWSILKNCIGKDLAKIPMPVNFNEPLSMLQRLTEDLEYSSILDRAAQCESSCEQMCHVAAFTVSSYSTTSIRTGKPFNPLLGETYELDRTFDQGWRCITEQVSHHPPASALYAEHKDWIFWQEFTCSSKFRGKYLLIIPQGVAHIKFTRTGNHYTWRKVATTVHNIIVGRLWIDQSGEMDIVNHTTKDKCHLKYDAYNYFSRDTPRKVTGIVTDANKTIRYALSGTWDNKIDAAKVVYSRHHLHKGQPNTQQKNHPQTLPPSMLWKRVMPPDGHDKMYGFTTLAMTLNQVEEGVAPTDSRLRPDQRLMENTQWDEANAEKQRLEEKQRTKRRKREADAAEAQAEGKVYEGYRPTWFEKVVDDLTSTPIHVYKGGYWEAKEKGDWNMTPDIFGQDI